MRRFVVKIEVIVVFKVTVLQLGFDPGGEILFLEHLLQVPDVVDGVPQRVHLRHLLVLRGRRDVRSEDVEPRVDLLYPISFPGISSCYLWRDRGWNGITQGRVESNFPFVGTLCC